MGRGALFVVILVGLGVTCWRTRALGFAEATQLWSAVGTVGAVAVALALAFLQTGKERRDEAKRAAAAAILLSGDIYNLRAAMSSVVDHAEQVKQNPFGYGQWLSGVSHYLKNYPPVIADKYLPFVGDLPPDALFDLTIADRWLANFKKRYAFDEGVTLLEVANGFSVMIDEIVAGYRVVVSATDRLHPLSQVPGRAPWNANAPSWAVPPELEE
ncbi:hypothetical protein CSC76_05930 [Pseudoxanthomonas mexicana]|nr:hypothetical protein CSC76_05930 [Pseudoxanthomonas mexicana]